MNNIIKSGSGKTKFLFVVICLSLMSIAMPAASLGTAWPFVRDDMGLRLDAAGILPIIDSLFFILICTFNGQIAKYLRGEKRCLIGLILLSACFFAFSAAPNFLFIAIMTSFVGISTSLINNSISEYSAANLTARQYNWTACFFGLGATVSPIIMTQMILFAGWRSGYVTIASFQSIAAVLMLLSIMAWVWKKSPNEKSDDTAEINTSAEHAEPGKHFITAARYKFLSLIIFFLYVGMEVATALWIVSVMIEARGLYIGSAGIFPTVFFGCLMAGRLLFGFFAKWLGNMKILRVAIALIAVGFALLVFTNSIIGIALVGLGHAPVFPTLMHETPRRFGRKTLSKLVGFQLAVGSAGSALVSAGMGLALTRISPEAFFPIVIIISVTVFVINEIVAGALRRVQSST